MALISQESLLGRLIPDIYIDGITLESSGTPAIVDNPHIDHHYEQESRKAFDEAAENRTLRVSVDLSLKETLDNDLIGSWFRQQDFHKYLKIEVVMANDTRLIDLLSYSQNMINFITTGTSEYSLTQEEINTVIAAFGSEAEANAALGNKNLVQTANLSVSADVVGDNSDLTQVSSYIDSDGNSIHDFTYRAVFELDVINPKNLAIFAVSYLDLGALKDDYDLEFDEGTLDNQNGKVVAEIVIKKNQVVSTSSIYVMPDGQYWTGPIHQPSANSYATGSESTVDSVKLIRRRVPNDKIQDFRDVAEIMKYSLDLSDASETINILNQSKLLSNDRQFMNRKDNHFSELWTSRDSNGACRFMFSFDMRSFLETNSPYGKLLNKHGNSVRDSILNASKVRTLKILRRRIKRAVSSNHLGSPVQGQVLFDKAVPYNSLVLTASKSNGKISEVVTPRATIREINPVISSDLRDYGIKYYTGQDRTMASITDGIYEYGLKIDVEDGTVRYLRSITDNLSLLRRDLILYLEYGSRLGMTKFLQEVSNPHIDNQNERVASIIENKGHYDPIKNRFTDKFQEFLDSQYVTQGAPFYNRRPWIDASAAYAEALATISAQAEKDIESNGVDIAAKINLFLSPTSGTPMGIMAVINLFDHLITKYKSLTGDDYVNRGRTPMQSTGSSASADSHVSSGQNIPGNIIEAEHWFKMEFDSNVQKSNGLDYLTNFSEAIVDGNYNKEARQSAKMAINEYKDVVYGLRQTRGLKVIDGGYWVSRVKAENSRWFAEPNPNLDFTFKKERVSSGDTADSTSYSFISPSYVLASNAAYNVGLNADDDYYMLIESQLIGSNQENPPASNNTSSDTKQSDTEKSYQSTMQNVFALLNVTVESAMQKNVVPLYLTRVTQANYKTLTICEEQQLQAVDPYPGWTQDSEGNIVVIGSQNKEQPLGSVNSNYVGFFGKCASLIVENAVNYAEMNVTEKASAQQIFANTQSIGLLFDLIKTDSQVASSISASNTGSTTAKKSIDDVVKSFPNAIKSIIASQLKPTVVTQQDNQGWTSKSKFNFNYSFLQMVQRFDGFEKVKATPQARDMGNTTEELSVLKPRWVKLTKDFYLSSRGEEIVCRLHPYVCEHIGIAPKPGIEAPVYDEYFIITPPVKDEIITRSAPMAQRFRTQLMSKWDIYSDIGSLSRIASTMLVMK